MYDGVEGVTVSKVIRRILVKLGVVGQNTCFVIKVFGGTLYYCVKEN